MGNSRVPQRTCVGCRETFSQDNLLRLVRSPDAEVLADLSHKLPGRGVYLCYRRECIETALIRDQLQRGFRQPIAEIKPEQLTFQVVGLLQEQLQGLIGLLRKAGQLQVGASQVHDRLGRESFAFLVLAEDISQGRADKLLAKSRACNIDCVFFATKLKLGHWVGKGESSALGIKPGGLAERFKQAFARYRQLSGEL